jgi:S-adenosylmethionine hydrolase
MNPPIVILTDFGTADPFVGIMKGVIHQIAPGTPIIDLTHDIPPGDILHGAVTLWQSVEYFAPDSTFLAVVDPGVGTSRRPILVKNEWHHFIAPDNGVLSFILDESAKGWEISNPQLGLPDPGITFHGRDIFAPAAAHASLGVPARKFGDPISNFNRLASPQLALTRPGQLTGQILFPDRFGNLLTSLGKFNWTMHNRIQFRPWVGDIPPFSANPESLNISLKDGKHLSWRKTFADIPPGECAVLLGSSGLLEIASNRQSAANLLNLAPHELITLQYKPADAY